MVSKIRIKQEAQAALEFLATYGWAFLVILIIIAALSYFGILSPSKLLPDRCNFGAEFGCVDYILAGNGVNLRLKNNLGEPIIINGLSAATEKQPLSCTSPIIGTVWKSGEVKEVPVSCDFTNSGLVAGEKGKFNLKLTYYSIRSGSAFSKDVQGDLYTTMKEGLVPSIDLVGLWYFDEGSGTTTTDSSGNGNNGRLFNGVNWVTGKKGSALSFDGVDDFIEVSDADSLDAKNGITIEAWINLRELTANADQDMIVNKEGIPYEIAVHDNTGPDDGLHSCGKSSDQIAPYNLAFYIGGLSGLPSHNCGWKDGGGPIPKNVWTHVAITYDGSQGIVRTYMNSVIKKEYTGVSGTIQVNNNNVRIGARGTLNPPPQTNGGALFNGIIDEVKIYNRSLTSAEILAEYNS